MSCSGGGSGFAVWNAIPIPESEPAGDGGRRSGVPGAESGILDAAAGLRDASFVVLRQDCRVCMYCSFLLYVKKQDKDQWVE